MLNLLKKEFGLASSMVTYLLIASAGMAMIPNYPILVTTFMLSIGLSISFQIARETQDIQYSIILPIEKKDIVKAKYLMVVFIELASFLILLLIVIIKAAYFSNSIVLLNNPLMNSNVAFLGYVLICFTIFNICYLTQFFKTAYQLKKPFLIYAIFELLAITLFETLHHLPGMSKLNAMQGQLSSVQLIVLLLGILCFIGGTLLSYHKSAQTFECLDL